MNTKLTAALAAKYFGCKVTTQYDEGKSYKMVGISEYEGNLQVEYGGATDWWNISQCQLVLKPLERISDEDAIEVAKMLQSKTNIDWTGAGKDTVTTFLHTALFGWESQFEDEDGNALLTGCLTEIIDYLRSKGYDIDNAIADGWAVEEKEGVNG